MDQAEADYEQASGILQKLKKEFAAFRSDSGGQRTGSNFQFLLEKRADLVAILAAVQAEMNLFVKYSDGNMLVRDELLRVRPLLTMYFP
jgi:hypothetical protein